ncbi:hypothetical protein HK096_005288 [Nowakowskiella sp. JEL0078]|nr:hypothetical protein HK096_005288 [Nowakowskiella sp. JEL0078]
MRIVILFFLGLLVVLAHGKGIKKSCLPKSKSRVAAPIPTPKIKKCSSKSPSETPIMENWPTTESVFTMSQSFQNKTIELDVKKCAGSEISVSTDVYKIGMILSIDTDFALANNCPTNPFRVVSVDNGKLTVATALITDIFENLEYAGEIQFTDFVDTIARRRLTRRGAITAFLADLKKKFEENGFSFEFDPPKFTPRGFLDIKVDGFKLVHWNIRFDLGLELGAHISYEYKKEFKEDIKIELPKFSLQSFGALPWLRAARLFIDIDGTVGVKGHLGAEASFKPTLSISSKVDSSFQIVSPKLRPNIFQLTAPKPEFNLDWGTGGCSFNGNLDFYFGVYICPSWLNGAALGGPLIQSLASKAAKLFCEDWMLKFGPHVEFTAAAPAVKESKCDKCKEFSIDRKMSVNFAVGSFSPIELSKIQNYKCLAFPPVLSPLLLACVNPAQCIKPPEQVTTTTTTTTIGSQPTLGLYSKLSANVVAFDNTLPCALYPAGSAQHTTCCQSDQWCKTHGFSVTSPITPSGSCLVSYKCERQILSSGSDDGALFCDCAHNPPADNFGKLFCSLTKLAYSNPPTVETTCS